MLARIFFIILTLSLTACSTFFKKNASVTEAQAATANLQLGLAYLQNGDIQRAHQRLLLVEQQAPSSVAGQGAMAYFLETTGNLSSADAYYRRAIAINPRSGVAQNNYGTFLCRQGHYAVADQHFLLALQDPDYQNKAQVYENAGLCAMQVVDKEKAKAYFLRAIQEDPNRAVSWLQLGHISYQQKDYFQAKQYLDHYMQLTKDPLPNALWLGAVLARVLGDQMTAGRYTLMLQTRFPNSESYKALVQSTESKNKKKQLYY